jgi:hypothetical protein
VQREVELMARRKLRSKAAKRGRSNREKGHRYERTVAERFRTYAIGAEEAERGLGQARTECRVSDVEGVPGFWIEAKHKRGGGVVVEAMEQAIAARFKHPENRTRVPLVVFRPHKTGGDLDLAVLRLGDFLELLEELHFLRDDVNEGKLAAGRGNGRLS